MAPCGAKAAIVVVVLAAALASVAPPWRPFPDRLSVIVEEAVVIDNVGPYDDSGKWAVNGTHGMLHAMNPTRVSYFNEHIRAHLGAGPVHLLDMGCGGGLVSNALANLPGYDLIQGVDLSAAALEYATSNAKKSAEEKATAGMRFPEVRFSRASVYELSFENASFDAIIMSDVLEHLTDVRRALREAFRLLRPGGVFLFDTISRTPATYLGAIIFSEYIFKFVPRGTHDWRLFILPEELKSALRDAGFQGYVHQAFNAPSDPSMAMDAFRRGEKYEGWRIDPPSDRMMSYIGYATKP